MNTIPCDTMPQVYLFLIKKCNFIICKFVLHP